MKVYPDTSFLCALYLVQSHWKLAILENLQNIIDSAGMDIMHVKLMFY